MKHIISLFKGSGLGPARYVLDHQDGTWSQMYNPKMATAFPSKKAAVEWVTTKTNLDDRQYVIEPFAAEVERFTVWFNGGGPAGEPQPVIDSHSRPYNKDTDGPAEVLEWRWENSARGYRGLPEPRSEHYRTWPELYMVFKHLFKVEAHFNNDHTGVLRTIEVYTPQNGKFEDFEREVMMVLDRVEHIDEDGWRILEVFDHYLSEYGNSVTLQEKDGKWKVEGRYSYGEDEGDTLEKAFEYLRKNRYYNRD